MLVSILFLFGGICQFYVIIIGGQAYPLDIFPGLKASSSFFDGRSRAMPDGAGGAARDEWRRARHAAVTLAVRLMPFLPSGRRTRWNKEPLGMKREPHPFARFINILGRGKTLTRSLTVEEAEEAMGMILAGQVLPEQLGAFLMLLRVKKSPVEIAGFVRAARACLTPPPPRACRPRLVVLRRQGPSAALVHPVGAGARAQRLACVHTWRGSAHGGTHLYRRGPADARHPGRDEPRRGGGSPRA